MTSKNVTFLREKKIKKCSRAKCFAQGSPKTETVWKTNSPSIENIGEKSHTKRSFWKTYGLDFVGKQKFFYFLPEKIPPKQAGIKSQNFVPAKVIWQCSLRAISSVFENNIDICRP